MAANNEVGTLQPLGEAAALAHGAGALVLCDAVQAAGVPGVDLRRDGLDLARLTTRHASLEDVFVQLTGEGFDVSG
jgi:cysteine desulfurase